MNRITIAIDGYSGCGKSTTARAVAEILGYKYIDSGAMYRAVTLYFLQNHISFSNPKEIAKAIENIQIDFRPNSKTGQQETYLNGLNVEQDIRSMEVSSNVSPVSAISEVRHAMVELQRKLGKNGGVIMDGRDIGTVVFPNAELKIFMSAQDEVRAERRQRELLEKGHLVAFDEILNNLRERDRMDTSRKEAPLRRAQDARDLDTTHLTFDEQVDEVARMALRVIHQHGLEANWQ
jgi:cytidylate kinase